MPLPDGTHVLGRVGEWRGAARWVPSGSLCGWGDPLIPAVDRPVDAQLAHLEATWARTVVPPPNRRPAGFTQTT
jgi:hypothetical protein